MLSVDTPQRPGLDTSSIEYQNECILIVNPVEPTFLPQNLYRTRFQDATQGLIDCTLHCTRERDIAGNKREDPTRSTD